MDASDLSYRRLLKDELAAVESLLLEPLGILPDSVQETMQALVGQRGKRLRPALGLLSAHLCGAEVGLALPVAAALEMLHTATLIHDDLLDEGWLRRGVATMNAHWAPETVVLTGDIAFAWAAELATRGEDLPLMRRFSETARVICGGELEQMFAGRGTIPTEAMYYRRVYAKTASLFALAMEIGPRLANAPASRVEDHHRFGRLLGQAFQITDDVLDFMGDEATLGKPLGSDLRQGLITLPVTRYIETHDDPRVDAVLARTADEATIRALVDDLRRSDAANWAMTRAEAHIAEAECLLVGYPDSPHRQAVHELAHFAVQRRY
jgi:geranylgeranyl pyrophosphate synthase